MSTKLVKMRSYCNPYTKGKLGQRQHAGQGAHHATTEALRTANVASKPAGAGREAGKDLPSKSTPLTP